MKAFGDRVEYSMRERAGLGLTFRNRLDRALAAELTREAEIHLNEHLRAPLHAGVRQSPHRPVLQYLNNRVLWDADQDPT